MILLYLGVLLVAFVTVWPQLRPRAVTIATVDVHPDANIDSAIAWPTMPSAGIPVLAVAVPVPENPQPAPATDEPLPDRGADFASDLYPSLAVETRTGFWRRLKSRLAERRQPRYDIIDDLPPLVATADMHDPNGVAPDVQQNTVVDADPLEPVPAIDDTTTLPIAAAQDTTYLAPATKGKRRSMLSFFLDILFGKRRDRNDSTELPSLHGGLPDLLATTGMEAPALKPSENAEHVASAADAAAKSASGQQGPAAAAAVEATTHAITDITATIDDDTDMATIGLVKDGAATQLPDVDRLLASVLPDLRTHTPAEVIAAMPPETENAHATADATSAAAEPHIPAFLSLDEEEAATFEADEEARRTEEARVRDEYSAAAADADLRAKVLAEEAEERNRDRVYAKWASDFVGDPDAYVDVDTRSQIVEDLRTFGDDGIVTLRRIADEDPVFAQRARELLAEVA